MIYYPAFIQYSAGLNGKKGVLQFQYILLAFLNGQTHMKYCYFIQTNVSY